MTTTTTGTTREPADRPTDTSTTPSTPDQAVAPASAKPPRRRLRSCLTVMGVLTLAVAVLASGWWGWQRWTTRPQGNAQSVALAAMVLPTAVDGAAVVGIGEATHGNAEFYTAKQAIVEQLVTRHGYRVIVFEGDHGGAQLINQYVTGQRQMTAETAARAFDFSVYKTTQMATLLRWIHDHNQTVPAEQQVQVAGVDMQRWDASKTLLGDYLRHVDPAAAASVATIFTPTNATFRSMAEAQFASQVPAANRLLTTMTTNRAAYEAKTSPAAYAMALHTAQVLTQGLQVQGAGDADYAKLRDQFMATNTQWIVDHSPDKGKVAVIGHNGHVEKTGAALAMAGVTSMGQRLAATYADRYVVIGTAFTHTTFNVSSPNGRTTQSYTQRTPISGIFANHPVGYLDFAKADATNRALLGKPTRIGDAGEAFLPYMAYVTLLRSTELVPSAAFDALIFVQDATPTTNLP